MNEHNKSEKKKIFPINKESIKAKKSKVKEAQRTSFFARGGSLIPPILFLSWS